MRVLHFAKTFSPLSETFIYDYVTELERQGGDNHVMTFRRVNEEDRPFPKVHVIDRPSRWHPRRLVNRALVPLGLGEPRTSDWSLIRDRLASGIDAVDPDVIHAHFGPAGTLIAPVAEAENIPLVVSFHGFDAFKLPSEPFWRDKYPDLFEKAACITVVSKVMEEHLTEADASVDNVAVVRVGKRMDDYPYRAPTAPLRHWISIGRLVEKKGFSDCIHAFRLLTDEFPDASLDIIGDGPCYDSLRNVIDTTGLSGTVRLLGERPHDEVKQRLASADGFVLCSKEATDKDREGVPTVLMEAQAIGLPVVSTTHSGIPEVIPDENQEYLAPEGDVDQLAECLRQLSGHSAEDLKNFSERGRLKVEQDFNLSSEVNTLSGIYESLIVSSQ